MVKVGVVAFSFQIRQNVHFFENSFILFLQKRFQSTT